MSILSIKNLIQSKENLITSHKNAISDCQSRNEKLESSLVIIENLYDSH